jgi:hypothetical protein
MKRMLGMTIASGIFAWGAAAQDGPDQMKVKLEKMAAEAKVISLEGGVMGPAVKGAPYSADEIRESTQTLGDGTRIHSETKTTIYRDSEGRVRRETPNSISIWDPVTGTNYVLNPSTMTARKMSMNFVFTKGTNVSVDGERGQSFSFSYSTAGDDSMVLAKTLQNEVNLTSVARAKAEAAVQLPGGAVFRTNAGKKETLGTQMMEGVNAEGVRVTNTIEQGAIGNDRPIQSITERWYSQELQTNVMTKRTDPRNGEEVVKLTNVHRGEPSPVLFELPPGYTVK